MAHFYGTIQGNRSERTACGIKGHGFTAHIRGWDLGVKVEMTHDYDSGEDKISLKLTGGSNQPGSNVYLGSFSESEFKKAVENQSMKVGS